MISFAIFLLLGVTSGWSDEPPPKGPPWTDDFWQAQITAIKTGRPMVILCRMAPDEKSKPVKPTFVEAALAEASLAVAYDEAVWVDLQMKDSTSDAARAIERVALRLGWKRVVRSGLGNSMNNMFPGYAGVSLLTPDTLKSPPKTSLYVSVEDRQGDKAAPEMTGDSIAKAVRAVNASLQPSTNLAMARETKAADQRAAKLERPAKADEAVRGLRDADWVVRYRAFQYLKEEAPESLSKHLPTLLAFTGKSSMKKFGNGFGPNLDEYRRALERLGFENRNFLDEIIDWLGSFDSPQATAALNSWSDPERLEHLDNPMRCRLATSLGKRGDNQTLKILEPWIVSGDYLNYLTTCAVNGAAEIGERHPKSILTAIAILKRGYPPLPKEGNQYERDIGHCLKLAATVHQHLQSLTEKKVEFPDKYDEDSRKKLMASW